MSHVLTLIGNDATPLSDAHVAAVTAAIPGLGTPDWLANDRACDLPCPADTDTAHIRKALEGAAIDLVVQPAAHRRKKLLVADMDSTIIQQECIDELADALGLRDRISDITERAMRGELEFEPALKERVALLKGLEEATLQSVFDKQIVETPGGRALCATMRAHGGFCALVSGGFTFFTERVAANVGFNANQANELIFEAGKLTGDVGMPILGRQAKIDALKHFTKLNGLDPVETMAVGDGANDLGMIGEAGLGVAFHAKPVVAEAAAAQVDHGDLSALLYIQGYRAEDITTAL